MYVTRTAPARTVTRWRTRTVTRTVTQTAAILAHSPASMLCMKTCLPTLPRDMCCLMAWTPGHGICAAVSSPGIIIVLLGAEYVVGHFGQLAVVALVRRAAARWASSSRVSRFS